MNDAEALAAGLKKLEEYYVADTDVVHYDSATDKWWRVRDDDVRALGRATGPDAYYRWCNSTDAESVDMDGLVYLDTMPDHLRTAPRAAGNWGMPGANGSILIQLPLREALERVAADPDGYDTITFP